MRFLRIQDEIEYSVKRYKLKRDIENLLLLEGYKNIEPSIFEDYEEFISVNKRVEKSTTVKVLNGNGKISILRPDVTTNLIRNFAPKWEKNLKLKLFYYSKIFKNSKLGTKEVRQMGIEYLGEKEIKADEEVIDLALRIISKYRDNYILEIGSSDFLNGLLGEFYFEEEEYKKIIDLIYKKNNDDLKSYISKFGKIEATETLKNILEIQGTYDEIKNTISDMYLNEQMQKGFKELGVINSYLEKEGLADCIQYDLSMVAELGYYAGVIFKGYFPDSNREIIKGGRYDSLTQEFGDRIPAIGFSIELDELLKILYRKGEI